MNLVNSAVLTVAAVVKLLTAAVVTSSMRASPVLRGALAPVAELRPEATDFRPEASELSAAAIDKE